MGHTGTSNSIEWHGHWDTLITRQKVQKVYIVEGVHLGHHLEIFLNLLEIFVPVHTKKMNHLSQAKEDHITATYLWVINS